MFGPHWLVGPVYTEGVKSRSIFLPALPSNLTWVYYFNLSEVGNAGGRFELGTPIGQFPLFFIRPADTGYTNGTSSITTTAYPTKPAALHQVVRPMV